MTTKRHKSKARNHILKLRGRKLTFGALLVSVRATDELSQSEMARRLGISRAHLCDVEKERRFVSPERAAHFAKALGYSVAQFVALSLETRLNRMGLNLKIDVKEAA
jgi:transcriptional regulator with XRE-family HTH domain